MQLAASVGLILDSWQALALEDALGETELDTWSAFEVALIVARQNGKGSILEARELAGLFLFGEKLILHSAHEFKTAAEAYLRVKTLIDGSDELSRLVLKYSNAHGDEGITLRSGARLRFVARTGGSGRGFTGDCVILDEAYNLSQGSMAALLPTLSARPNPQIWYTSSAPLPESTVLASVRARGIEGKSPRLAFLEWSAPDGSAPDDPRAWAQANPALGIRISATFIEGERAALDEESFARERLSIPAKMGSESDLDLSGWRLLEDESAVMESVGCFAVDVSIDRASGAIAAAGPSGSRTALEVIDHRRGTAWIIDRCVELDEGHGPATFVIDSGGPAASMVDPMRLAGLTVETTSTDDVATATADFLDGIETSKFVHGPQVEIDAAIVGARRRQIGDGKFAFGRKASNSDVSPLVAISLAAWGADKFGDLAGSIW